LRKICLEYSDLPAQALSDWIESFPQLKELDFPTQGIRAVPESKYLQIMNEIITQLPDSIKYFTAIESISLDCPELETLSDWIGDFSNLHSFSLKSNKIKHLPESMRRLNSLVRLYIECPKMKVPPEWISHLIKLDTFELNNLTNFLDTFIENLRSFSMGSFFYSGSESKERFYSTQEDLDKYENQCLKIVEMINNVSGKIDATEIYEVINSNGEKIQREKGEEIYRAIDVAFGTKNRDKIMNLFKKVLPHLKINKKFVNKIFLLPDMSDDDPRWEVLRESKDETVEEIRFRMGIKRKE
jgi:hypothetical protein